MPCPTYKNHLRLISAPAVRDAAPAKAGFRTERMSRKGQHAPYAAAQQSVRFAYNSCRSARIRLARPPVVVAVEGVSIAGHAARDGRDAGGARSCAVAIIGAAFAYRAPRRRPHHLNTKFIGLGSRRCRRRHRLGWKHLCLLAGRFSRRGGQFERRTRRCKPSCASCTD